MKLVDKSIKLSELEAMAKARFGNMVKAVVDIEKQIMAVDAELHADEEADLLANGSRQKDLWGLNLYPDKTGEEFIEFDSLINVRPSHGNLSMGIENESVRKKIRKIVEMLVEK